MGIIYDLDVTEYLYVQETTKQNIYCLDISEQILVTEALKHQFHDLNVHEIISIIEKPKGGLTLTLSVAEPISLVEYCHPRVFVADVIEVLGLGESINETAIAERLLILESATYDLATHVSETIVIVEDASFRLVKLMKIEEVIDLQEGLTGFKIGQSGAVLPFIPASCYEPLPSLGTPVEDTPSGVINGSNTEFELSFTPINDWLQVFLNGVLQEQGIDYNISGTTITFVVAPLTGFTLKAYYFR